MTIWYVLQTFITFTFCSATKTLWKCYSNRVVKINKRKLNVLTRLSLFSLFTPRVNPVFPRCPLYGDYLPCEGVLCLSIFILHVVLKLYYASFHLVNLLLWLINSITHFIKLSDRVWVRIHVLGRYTPKYELYIHFSCSCAKFS